MSRKRTFDDGKVTATFATEEQAQDFDNYLETVFTLTINGEEVDRWKAKDRFDPYEFFCIERSKCNEA